VAGRIRCNAEALVIVAPAEKGGVDEGRAGGIELRHEGVEEATAEGRLESAQGRGEVAYGAARHVGVAEGVYRNGEALVRPKPTQIGGVEEGGAGGIEFRHEGVDQAAEGRLEGARCRREVAGSRDARHVGVAGRVQGDAEALFRAGAAEKGGVDEGRAGGIQLRHEGAAEAAK